MAAPYNIVARAILYEQKMGGKKIKSISERIKSKKGRIRGSLMGKRVNFLVRSVTAYFRCLI